MASVNKCIIIGRLGKNPESRQTQNGVQVASFSVATSEKYTDKTGQKQEKTEWHNIVMYNKLAQLAGQYLQKGSEVYIEGKITTRSWDDQTTGQKKYMTEIIGHQMQFMSKPPQQQQGQANQQQNQQQFNAQPQQQQQGVNSQQVAQQFNAAPVEDLDLPF